MPSKIDELFYDIGFQVDESGVKQAQQRSRQFNETVTRGQKGLERFGEAGTAALRQVADGASLTSGQMAQVTESVNRVVDSLRSDLAEGIARARLELEKGIIDEDEFRDTARASIEAFEDELSRLERRLDRTGALPPAARRRIVNEFEGTGEDAVDGFINEFAADADRAEEVLRETGREGGRKFGREVDRESRDGLDNLERFLRGGFIAGVVTALGFAAQRIVRFFADVGRKIVETLRRAGEIEGVERAFDTLASSAGLNAVELLEQLRAGARGTASDLDLMRSSAEALQTGLRGTEEQFGELVNIGRRLAKTIGTDANEAFQRLVRGVVRGRRRILDDIGILVDFQQAHADFAAQLGVSVEALDEQQKAQARLNAVVERGREVVAALGPDVLTTGERVDQVATFVRNVTNETIAAFATTPRIREWLDAFADGSEDAVENMRNLELQIGATVDVIVDSFTTFEGFIRLLNELARASTGGGFGPGFAEQFGQAIARRAQQQTLRDIRGISDLEKLEERRIDTREQMVQLQEELNDGTTTQQDFTRRLLNLNEQLLTIAQQRRRLSLREEGGGEGGGLTKEQIEARRKAVRGLVDQLETLASVGLGALQFEQLSPEQQELVGELQAVEAEITKIERALEAGAGTDAMARRLEFLRERHADLREEISETIRGYDDLEEALGRIRESVGIPEGIEELPQPGLQEVSNILAGRTSTEEREALLDFKDAVEEIRDAGLEGEDAFEALVDAMASSGAEARQVRGIISGLASTLGLTEQQVNLLTKALTDGEGSASELAEGMEQVVSTVDGILRLADAFDVLDDSTRKVLEGVQSIAGGVAQIASGNIVSGIVQGVGGLTSVLSGLLGPSPTEQRQREDIIANTRAIQRLTESVDRMASVFNETSANIIVGIKEALSAFREREAAGFPRVSEFIEQTEGAFLFPAGIFAEELRKAGVTGEGFGQFLQNAGLDPRNFELLIALLEGRFLVGDEFERAQKQFESLQEAVDSLDFSAIFEGLPAQLDILQREIELFDIEKPIDQLRRMRDLLLEFADLPAELEAAIRGANLQTPEGRAQFEQALQRAFRLLQTEAGLSAIPEGMSRQDFIDFILQLESLEDRISEGEAEGGADAQSFQIFRGVTETTAQRLEGLGSTRNLILHNIDRNVAAIAGDMGVGSGPAGGFLEPGGFPPDGGGGGGDVEAEMIPGGPILLPSMGLQPPPEPPSTQQILLDIAVDADIDLRGVDSPQEVAERVSELLGDRVSADVNERLGRLLQQVRRSDHGVGMERRV